MAWKTEWKALAERIKALLDAGRFFFATFPAWGNDFTGASSELNVSADEIAQALADFQASYASLLPYVAAERLKKFVDSYWQRFAQSSATAIPGAQARLTRLAAFRSEMDYLLSDTDAVAQSIVERGFLHLQRSIVADNLVAERWRSAFEAGEPECERLGAVHLLLHGIWAFKASATGERTDLVLGEKLEITPLIEVASEALVLTEWKCVRKPSELDAKSKQAFSQADNYSVGALAGFEMASRRYLVMVSKDRLTMPPAKSSGHTIYEYRNIAVSPSVPSVYAKVTG
jgi:hypothetical protein